MKSKVDASFNKARLWREPSERLREILLDCGLDEELKWGKPCYLHEGKNLAILQRMNDFLALMFFKGALMKDPQGILEKPGENSRHGRRICFASVEEVVEREAILRAYVRQAIEVERKGLKVSKTARLELISELQGRLDADPALKAAFEGLTPGRQRAYNLYFSAAKQSKTRQARIEKVVPMILAGKGLRDR